MVEQTRETAYTAIDTGITKHIGALLREKLGGHRVTLACDAATFRLFAEGVAASLDAAGYAVLPFVIPLGEEQKTLPMVSSMTEKMNADGMTDGDIVLALGGGAIADIAGFAASVYVSRLFFVQLPTTFTAQARPMATGFARLNVKGRKDGLVCRAVPAVTLIDPDALITLSRERISEGMAEHIRLASLVGGAVFDIFLNTACEKLFEGRMELANQAETIRRALLKTASDDHACDALLNIGCVFGHVLECASHYRVSYGTAAGIGLLMLTRYTEAQGLTSDGTFDTLRNAFTSQGLPVKLDRSPGVNAMREVLEHTAGPGGMIETTYLKRIGSCGVTKISMEHMIAVVEQYNLS